MLNRPFLDTRPIISRQRRLLIFVTAFGVAAASGLFVAGVGNAASWFVGALLISMLIGVAVAKSRVAESSRDSLMAHGHGFRRYWRTAIWLLGSSSTVALAWLVLNGEPLPAVDLDTAALATAVFCMLTIICVLYLHRLSILSFPGLFLSATFLFTCSSLILYQLEGLAAFSAWQLVDIQSVLIGMPIVMLAFSSFLVGALLVPLPPPQKEQIHHESGSAYSAVLRRVGLALYVLSIAVVAGFTLTGSALTLAFEGGYGAFAGARKAGELSQILRATLDSFLPMSVLILAATSNSIRAHVRVLLLAIPVMAIMFLSGDRAVPLPLILLIISAGRLLHLRITWRQSLVVIGLVVLLVPTIANVRKTPVSDWSAELLRRSVTNQVEDRPTYEQGPLRALLTSTGTSYQTLMATVMVVPASEGYRYGRDYLRPVLVAIPFYPSDTVFLGVELGEQPSDWVKGILNDDRVAGPGYLQVAEAYLQFGAIGVLGLYVLLGWGLTRLWRYLATVRPDPRIIALSLIVMARILIWVRNQSGGILRTLLWGVLVVYVAPILLQGLTRFVARISANHRVPVQQRVRP